MFLPILRKRRQRSVDEAPTSPNNNVNINININSAGTGTTIVQATGTNVVDDNWSEPRSPRTRSPSIAIPTSPRMALPTWGYNIGTTDEIVYSKTCRGKDTCEIRFNVPKLIRPPSYLYYTVTNMHQNYLSYAKSRSIPQLRGKTPKKIDDVIDCFPALYVSSLRKKIFRENLKTRAFNASEIVYPAGLTAESFFNDTFTLPGIKLSENGIAWKIDRETMFQPGTNKEHYTPRINNLLSNEHFIVWMRLSAFSNVEKLYGIINQPIEPRNYTMIIENRYNSYAFKGEKSFFISNTQWFGAKNHFLAILFLVTGLLALVIALAVLGLHVMAPRKPAFFDPDLLKRELAKLNLENAAN